MKILITGGASGLGGAVTRRLAAQPDSVVYFTYSKSETLAKSIEQGFSNAIAIKCDFTNSADLGLLKTKMIEANIDILINNAYKGNFLGSYFHKSKPSEFLNDFEDNIIPTIEITQIAINLFRKKKSGKLITLLTSALLNTPPIGSSVYIADKAYLQQLVKVWAAENAKFNITSNSVSPSMLETNLTKDIDERLIAQIRESHPLKKLLTVEEVADAIFFLANASSQINGFDLVMNSASNIK